MENLHELGVQIERLTRASDKEPVLVTTLALTDGSSRLYETNISQTTGGRSLGKEVTPPRPAKLQVSTLTGFVDAVKASVAGDGLAGRIVHVEDYLTVSVKSTVCDTYGIRDTLLTAKHVPLNAFNFDEFYTDPAKFIIGLQVAFLATEDLVWLIKLASAVKSSGTAVAVNDDGINQTITVKQGEVTSIDVPIKPRIKLIPRTTFDEAAPVEREFLLRAKPGPGGAPAIAIFAVDGTKWQGESMRAIATYLKHHLPEGAVILA
jgi:hypothetical protein